LTFGRRPRGLIVASCPSFGVLDLPTIHTAISRSDGAQRVDPDHHLKLIRFRGTW